MYMEEYKFPLPLRHTLRMFFIHNRCEQCPRKARYRAPCSTERCCECGMGGGVLPSVEFLEARRACALCVCSFCRQVVSS